MVKIILNNEEFNFVGYHRSTQFNTDDIISNGYVNGVSGDNDFIGRLYTLAHDPITSIVIEKDGETIYSLNNINAKVVSIDEGFDGLENIVMTNLNLQFNQ